MDHDVPFGNGRPEIRRVDSGQFGRRLRCHWRIVQVVITIDADKGKEDLAVQRTWNRIDVPFFELQFIAQEIADHARRRSGQFQTNSRPFSALLQALFDFHQEVFRIIINIQVSVASDAERFDFQNIAAQEESFCISGDDVFQEEELMAFMLLAGRRNAVRDLDDAVDDRRRDRQDSCLDRAVPLFAAQEDGQIQVQAGQKRKRMAGIDGHRRDDRVDFPSKEAFQPQPLIIIEGIDTDEVQAMILQLLLDIFIVAILVADQFMDHRLDGLELFLRRHAGNVDVLDPTFDEVLDAGDTDHEEFIQIRCSDGNEIQLFQQRVGWDDSFAQDPFIEFDPCTFTI